MKTPKFLSLLLAFSMFASLPSCNERKKDSGGKKNSNKINAYFEAVDVSDADLSNSTILAAGHDKYYYLQNVLSDDTNQTKVKSLDLNSKELSDEQVSADGEIIFSDDNFIICQKYDEYSCTIEKTNLKDGTVLTAKTNNIWMAGCDSALNVYVFDGDKLCVYDEALNLSKETELSGLKDMPNQGKDGDICSMCVSGDGKVYFLFASEKSCSIYRIEDDRAVNITGSITDSDDLYGTITFDRNGKIILVTGIDTMNIDVIDPEDGSMTGMYEREEIYQFLGSSEKYDLIYTKEDGIYGSDYEGNAEESLLPEDSEIEIRSAFCKLAGNKLYIAVDNYSNSMQIVEVEAETGRTSVTQCSYIDRAAVADDGTLYFIAPIYNGNDSYKLYRHENDTENTEICSLYEVTEGVYIQDMDIDSEGNIIVTASDNSNNLRVDVFDNTGNLQKEIDVQSADNYPIVRVMQNENSEYFLCTEEGTVYALDIQKGECIKTQAKAINMFYSGCNGNNGYDFYYMDMAGVYGYNYKNDKSEKIAGWDETEGEGRYGSSIVIDPDTIICDEGKKLVRADQAKLDELNSKQIISMAVLSGDMIKSYVDKFNRENDNVRIVMNDYIKYLKLDEKNLDEQDERELVKQVTNAFEQDVINGKVPDIVMIDNMDVSSLVLKGFFTDMKSFMDNDPEINFSDYYSSVADALSYKGKMFAVSAFMDLELLSSSKKFEKMDYNTLFSLEKGKDEKIVEEWMVYNFENILYSSYVNDYVDIEKKTCDFGNSTFTDLLNFIRDNELTRKAYMESTGGHGEVTFDDKQAILSYSMASDVMQYALMYGENSDEGRYLTGYPSKDGEKGALMPLCTFGIPESSENKNEAWKFIRQFLLENGDNNNNDDPMQADLFSMYHKCMKSLEEKGIDKQVKEISGSGLEKISEADIKSYKELWSRPVISDILSYDIVEIITEEADKFYSGEVSAEETAKNLQSKVSLYLHEIS